jgi:hypothetical protein
MAASEIEVLSGEVLPVVDPLDTASELEEAPRHGSLAWLELQEHVTLLGRELPACHRVPAGASFRSDEDRAKRCAVVKAGGVACGAPGTKRYGVCLVHAGGGTDIATQSAKGSAKLARLRVKRELLGIGARSNGSPRALARLAAAERADEIAAALLAPLDARGLAPLDLQRAAVVILGETFPQSTASVEIELPAQGADVASMGWADMQALAARLLEG